MHSSLAAVVLALVPGLVLAQTSKPRPTGTLRVAIAVVGDNAEVKAIPLHALDATRIADSSHHALRTGLDGRMEAALPVGAYMLSSVSPVTVHGVQYRWAVAVQVSTGRPVDVELTNLNADTAQVAPEAGGIRGVASEMQVFGRVKDGVVKVLSGLGHGTGFLVDSAGLILTNAHVVEGAGDAVISVMLDSVTRVRAQVLARAQEADLAVIRIAPALAAGRPVATLATAKAQVGERVFAVGYPLTQELTLTSGIISSVRDGAIISDVNINQGNSGGPLFAMDGTVIAVNAFADVGDFGPGVAGSIAIERASSLIEAARARATAKEPPDTTRLPVMPMAGIPAADAKRVVQQEAPAIWKSFKSIGMGRFTVQVQTPFQTVYRMAALEAEIGKDRKKREAKAAVADDETYSELRGLYDWGRYSRPTAGAFRPAVGISVEPKS